MLRFTYFAAHALSTSIFASGGIPQPGLSNPPPFSGNLSMILQWVMWTVAILLIGGVLAVAGKMALQHNRGEGGQHLAALGWVLGACLLAASASALVGTFVF